MSRLFIFIIAIAASIFISTPKASAQLHGFSSTTDNTSTETSSSLPQCGGYLPQNAIAASPATYWTFRLGSPSRIFDAPWLVGCNPRQLSYQSPHNRTHQAIAFSYNNAGMVAAWVWQITLSDANTTPFIRQGQNRYSENGLLLESTQTCDNLASDSQESIEIYRFNYDQSSRLNRMEHIRPENCNFNQTAPIHLLSIYEYDNNEGDMADLPISLTETNLISNNSNIFEAEYLYDENRLETAIYSQAETEQNIEERYDYNGSGLLRRLTRLQDTGAISQRFEYLYGNRLGKINDAADHNSWEFRYDAETRLESLRVQNPASSMANGGGYVNFRASY